MGRPRVTGEQILVKRLDHGRIDLEEMAVEIERLNATGEYKGRPGEYAFNGTRGGIVFNPYKV